MLSERLLIGPKVGDRVMTEPASLAKSLISFVYAQGTAPGPGMGKDPELRGGRNVLEQPVPSVELVEVVGARPAPRALDKRPT